MQKSYNHVYLCVCFSGRPSAPVFYEFRSILTPFWEASGSKNHQKEVPEGCEKTAPKAELRAGEKVTLGSASRRFPEASRGGGCP